MLETFIQIIHVGVALFMILVVLVQGGNQGGVGAAFGGGSSSGVLGATGATTLLGKLTYGAAFIFMLTSITLTVMQGKGGDIGLKEKLRQATEGASTTTPATTAAPAAATTTPATTTPAAGTAPAAAETVTPKVDPAANPDPAASPASVAPATDSAPTPQGGGDTK
jgi:preprotein translocase subunit SecG